MQIKNVTASFCRKCLTLSLPVEMMIRFAQLVNPDYDIYRRTGLSEGMPISNQNAAQRIVADMIQDGFFVDFVEALIRIGDEGYMGRRYTLFGLNDAITGLIQEGYSFDPVSRQFFENQKERISPNWGRLQEGDERRMTVLRLDIAGNSVLVRNNSRDKIEKAYRDLRNIVNKAVVNRLGRLWTWEGDGALAAFLFGSMEKAAIFCGMDILHELYFYNRLRNPLSNPINVRIGVQTGLVRYSPDEMERLKNDTIKQAVELESKAAINSLAISYKLYMTMELQTMDLFSKEKLGPAGKYRLYQFGKGEADVPSGRKRKAAGAKTLPGMACV
jgi:class 3 adenylate cyclase